MKSTFSRHRRKTKIVATIGPASRSPETIRALIQAGLNVARLNFSHGSHQEHSEAVRIIREQAQELGTYVAILQDLCGPKIRIGEVENGTITLEHGGTLELLPGQTETGSTKSLYVAAFNPKEVLEPGERALLADGRVELLVREKTDRGVLCDVVAGGAVRSKSGIAVSSARLRLPCLTEKDLKDLDWTAENDVDYVALSFVGNASDIHELRDELKKRKAQLPVVAKLERAQCLDDLENIVRASDAVMVARGDLGLELPLQKVPNAQSQIIKEANYAGVPVITATQMLSSMVENYRPTRAEVSDVSTAVRDGTDAVMLSEETAIGRLPVRTLSVLDSILQESEEGFRFEDYQPRLRGSDRETVADSIAYAACAASSKLKAAGIIACTETGATARLVAKYRPQQPLFGASSQPSTLARMALYWGVMPVSTHIEGVPAGETEVSEVVELVRDACGLIPGTRVVVSAGLRGIQSGQTTKIEIREVQRG